MPMITFSRCSSTPKEEIFVKADGSLAPMHHAHLCGYRSKRLELDNSRKMTCFVDRARWVRTNSVSIPGPTNSRCTELLHGPHVDCFM